MKSNMGNIKRKYINNWRYAIMKINANMTIGELIRTYPQTVEALFEFNMGCVGCPSAQGETLAEAAMVHGIKLDDLLEKLNQAV